MKQLLVLSILGLCLFGSAYGRPKYILIPIEDVEVLNMYPPASFSESYLSRVARSAFLMSRSRQPHNQDPQFIGLFNQLFNQEFHLKIEDNFPHKQHLDLTSHFFVIPEGQRALAEDALQSGSSVHARSTPHGPDYVDYGAYTGGYGAFGWYSDHPVGQESYHRRR